MTFASLILNNLRRLLMSHRKKKLTKGQDSQYTLPRGQMVNPGKHTPRERNPRWRSFTFTFYVEILIFFFSPFICAFIFPALENFLKHKPSHIILRFRGFPLPLNWRAQLWFPLHLPSWSPPTPGSLCFLSCHSLAHLWEFFSWFFISLA